MALCAVILAAGRGRRMGADKALVDLSGQTAIERVVGSCRGGGVEAMIVVRAESAAPLPEGLSATVTVVEVAADGEMLDSVRAGIDAVPDHCDGALIFPVDYAMASALSVQAVADGLTAGDQVVLPLHDEHPGHPIGLARGLFGEIARASSSLREVVTADPDRVHVVRVSDPWIHQDLDTPEDLAAARAALDPDSGRDS